MRGLLGVWIGGASKPVEAGKHPGVRSLLAFWMGGASAPQAAVTPPVTETIPSGGGYPVHGGSLYWKRYQEELRRGRCHLSKKKRTLLDELDEMILELQSRVVEAPAELAEEEYERALRVSREMAWNLDACTDLTNKQIQAQIALLKAAIEEIDDEEAILLTLH